MKRERVLVIEVEKSSGSVYADLGVADADVMLVKARLAYKISEIIEDKCWNKTEAARVLGLPQFKLSIILRGHFREISKARMMAVLRGLGADVRIVIGQNPG